MKVVIVGVVDLGEFRETYENNGRQDKITTKHSSKQRHKKAH